MKERRDKEGEEGRGGRKEEEEGQGKRGGEKRSLD